MRTKSDIDNQIAQLQAEIASQPDQGPRRQLERRLQGLQIQRAQAPDTPPAPQGAPVLDRATSVQTLAPGQQQIFDLQEQASILLGQNALQNAGGISPGSPFSLDLPPVTRTAPEFEAAREEAERAAFERTLNLLNPEFERREEQLLDRLANQGLPQASRAFQSEFDVFNRGRNEATQQAALDAVLTGEQIRSQGLRDVLAGRQSALNEALLGRQVPLNETLSLLGAQQIQQPGFFPPGPVDVLGSNQLAQQAGEFKAQQRQQTRSNIGQIAGTVATIALLASSSEKGKDRVKGDVPGSEAIKKLDVDRWRYKGDETEHIGPMAEDWQEQTGLGDGEHIHMVDAFGVGLKAMQEMMQRIERLEGKRRG